MSRPEKLSGKANPSSLDSHSLGRRAVLKSAGGVAMSVLGATMLSGNLQPASAKTSTQSSQSKGEQPTGEFHKGMIGFQLAHEQFTVPEVVDLGVACEDAGFDVITFSDHFQPWQANEAHSGLAWVTMSAIGQRTKRIWMGTTVTCPTFRYNPAVVAEAFASLSLLTPGRIFLGLGSGEALNEQSATGMWAKWPERSQRLVEATDVIRKMWKGQQVEHNGEYFKVNARLYDPPAKNIPLLMAGNGPKAMKRVGQYADGLITDPKTWKKHKSEFEDGAKAGGKDASKMPVFIEQYAVVGDQKDAEVAAKLWRFGPKAWDPYYNVRDPQEIERRANAEVPLDKVTEGWPISTDPDVHVKAISELFDGGATEVHIHSGQPDQKRVIDFYGKQVIPRLKNIMAGK
jgi:TAT-translocated FGD2 family F420-dependent dehydrogenase